MPECFFVFFDTFLAERFITNINFGICETLQPASCGYLPDQRFPALGPSSRTGHATLQQREPGHGEDHPDPPLLHRA